MSREQWGNGFYAGKKSVKEQPTSLVGLFFHTYENGKIERQGIVKRALPGDRYLVMFFSFLDGFENGGKMFELQEMMTWKFYDTDKDMRYAYAQESGWSSKDAEEAEEFRRTIELSN